MLYPWTGNCVGRSRTAKWKVYYHRCDYRFTDTIMFKLFVSPDDRGPLLDELQKGKFYIIKGVPMYDSYSKEITFSSVAGIKPANDFREKRMDNALENVSSCICIRS